MIQTLNTGANIFACRVFSWRLLKCANYVSRRSAHQISLLVEAMSKQGEQSWLPAKDARLRDAGNTIVLIGHNLDVIKTADWLIDMGQDGGAGGSMVVGVGTPEAIAANADSHTGRYLARLL